MGANCEENSSKMHKIWVDELAGTQVSGCSNQLQAAAKGCEGRVAAAAGAGNTGAAAEVFVSDDL